MIAVIFTYGTRQRFRRRTRDITVRGRVDGLQEGPVVGRFALNGGEPRPLYVEATPDEGVDWLSGYKPSPAELRCRHLGEFCVEIDVDDPALQAGANAILVMVEAAGPAEAKMTFDWDPEPPRLPLDLADLGGFPDVQTVGQVVNGAFDLDSAANLLRSRAPVAPDALFVIGPPASAQEATYAVRFLEPPHSKWLGLSDFFAGMEEGAPPRGIKVGWSSAGMAVVAPRGEARSFLAWGDHSGRPEEWAIATHPPASVAIEAMRLYRVRHQMAIAEGVNRVRFRIWPSDEAEPGTWLCDERDAAVPEAMPRHRTGSFALFQHMGMPIEWSDIRLEPIDGAAMVAEQGGTARAPFLGRKRPGAF